MDWTTVGKIIVPLAPALGSILGGFIPVPGGSLAGQLGGQVIGNIIAKKLGLPPGASPDTVAGAINSATDKDVLIAKLKAAADELRSTNETYAATERAYFETVQKTSGHVNETMRVEVRPENRHWFYTGWRPTSGWIFNFVGGGLGLILLWATWKEVQTSPAPLKALADAWPLYVGYLGVFAAMVGVYVVARSQEKVAGVSTGTAAPKPKK